MDKMQITCQDLSVTMESKKIINSFNYTFENSKLYAIKGLNGSGKSTLLKIITGLALYDKGKLQINHKNYVDFSAQELSLLVSYVGTHNHFTFPMQVSELLENGRFLQQNIFGQLSIEDKTIIQEVISTFQLESLKSSSHR
jgi:ABC-type cobalamin/Fe3+-siderophores transport system ATPase subunit